MLVLAMYNNNNNEFRKKKIHFHIVCECFSIETKKIKNINSRVSLSERLNLHAKGQSKGNSDWELQDFKKIMRIKLALKSDWGL